MKLIQRIIAIIVLIPAVISLVAMLGGAIGVWFVNDTVTQVGVDILGAGVDFVDGTQESVTEVETLLLDAQGVVTEIDAEIERFGDDPDRNQIILDGIEELIGTDLETIVIDIDRFFSAVEQTVLALADALDSVRELPAVAEDAEQLEENVFREIATDIDGVRTRIAGLLAIVQGEDVELTDAVITDLNTATTDLSTQIGDMLAQVSTANTDLTTLETDLTNAQSDFARLIDLVSIGLTILFLFFALAFLSLTVHAWAFFRQRPPRNEV